MRTTIWIPDELVEEIKDAAWRQKMSLSAYLVGLHAGDRVPTKGIPVVEDLKTGVVSPAAGGFFNPRPKGGKE